MRKFQFEVRGVAVALCAAASLSLIACSSGSNNNGGMGGAKDASGDGTGAGGKGTGGKGMGGNGQGGAGGMVSLACSSPKYMHTSGFGAILDGWVVASNSTPPSLAPTLDADGGTISGTKVEIDKTDGSPGTTPVGSVKLTIPFDQPNEVLLFAQNMASINLMGQTVSAWIKLDSGLNTGPVNVGQAFLVLKTTALYNYAPSVAVSLDSSAGWVQLTINADSPPMMPIGYDPCDVREIDVVIQTGQLGTYTTAVVHIDTISVGTPVINDDGGSDGGGDTHSSTGGAGGGAAGSGGGTGGSGGSNTDSGSDTAANDDAATGG